MAETMTLKQVLALLEQGRQVEAHVVAEAKAELKSVENLLRIGRRTRKVARQLFLDGQLDKYPTSDTSDEYKLWRLVKMKEDET